MTRNEMMRKLATKWTEPTFADPAKPYLGSRPDMLRSSFSRRKGSGKGGTPSYLRGSYGKSRLGADPMVGGGAEALRQRLRGAKMGKKVEKAKSSSEAFSKMRTAMKRGKRSGLLKGRRQMIAPALGLAGATGLGSYALGKALGKRNVTVNVQNQPKPEAKQASLTPEMAANAAKVKAAQDPKKKGAEKPDLGAPGKKQAAIDDDFARDLNQMVGIDAPEARSDWQHPDVSVQGQATDRIDDHFLGWMREKAGEDVVKEAAFVVDPRGAATKTPDMALLAARRRAKSRVKTVGKQTFKGKAKTLLSKAKNAADMKRMRRVAAPAAVGVAGGMLLSKLMQKKQKPAPAPDTGVKTQDGQVKQAGVIENQENLDLMAKIRKAASDQFKVGSSDV